MSPRTCRTGWLSTARLRQQHLQADGVGHGLVSGVIGVQVITGVVRGVQPQRVGRIAHHRVEVDDAVEGSAGADPGVHRLTRGLARRGVIARSLERQQGRAEYPQAPGVRPGDQPLVPGDDLGRADVAQAEPDVVDPLKHDDVPDPRLVQGVPPEPRLGAGPAAPRADEHPVAADPLVGHREDGAGQRVQPAGQVVGPAGVGACGRAHSVGDRVAERHHGPVRVGRLHDEAADVVPRQGRGGELARIGVGGVVAGGRHPVDLLGVRVERRRAGPARQVHAHREILQRPHPHGHRIAEDLPAGRDLERRAAAISHRVHRARLHRSTRACHRHRHVTDP